ncbi:hypothetical protein [Gordonia sp. VNK21]|uniref:hypothetical protein n=1 Tax=Gordonia sp. VNK21 TaxID=3382483 RepID=UPI0038D508EA
MLRASSPGVRLSVSRSAAGLACVGLLVAGCGDTPRSADDPATNTASAEDVAGVFASSYNDSGMTAAVQRSFCSDVVGRYVNRASLADGSADRGSVALGAVTVDGHAGTAELTYSPSQQPPRRYHLDLRKDASQGWCVSSLAPDAGN